MPSSTDEEEDKEDEERYPSHIIPWDAPSAATNDVHFFANAQPIARARVCVWWWKRLQARQRWTRSIATSSAKNFTSIIRQHR